MSHPIIRHHHEPDPKASQVRHLTRAHGLDRRRAMLLAELIYGEAPQ